MEPVRLRPYQEEAVRRVCESLENFNAVLLVMATGLGKSVIFAEVARRAAQLGKVLVLAHRQELVYQAMQHLNDLQPGLEMRESRDATGDLRTSVTVGSIQSVVSRGRHTKLDYGAYSLVIIDEAHHAPTASYAKIVLRCREYGVKILGVTATPHRSDKKALGAVFDAVAYEYNIVDAVKDGWLVPIMQAFITDIDVQFDNIKIKRGDYDEQMLSDVLSEEANLHVMARVALDAAPRGPVLAFCSNIRHARLLADVVNRYAPGKAVSVDQETPLRDRHLFVEGFRDGAIPILCNCMIATEGFDCPPIASIIIGRPTRSLGFWLQMVGRGTRTLPGTIYNLDDAEARRKAIASSKKPHLVVYDLYGAHCKRAPVNMSDIFTGDLTLPDTAKLKTWVESQQRPVSMDEITEQAERIRTESMMRLTLGRQNIRAAKVHYKTKYADPFTILDILPSVSASPEKPTPWQMSVLERFGVEDGKVKTREDADRLISELTDRERKGLCTYKQMRLLIRHKIPREVVAQMTKHDASRLTRALSRGNWVYFAGEKPPRSLKALEQWRQSGGQQ